MGFLKIMGYITLAWLFFVAHVVLLLLAHSAVIAIRDGISMDAAITPLHSCIMADDYLGAYSLMRETLFSEIPFYSLLDGLFGHRSGLTYSALFYDTVKAVVAGVISYTLCRFNRLLSSEKHPILFGAVTSFWSSISIFGALLIVTWLRTFPSTECIIRCVALLVLCPVFLSLSSFFSLRHFGVPISFGRILWEDICGFLMGILDSLYIFLISCLSFDVLHRYIPDDFTLLMIIMAVAGISSYLYNYIKKNVLLRGL